MGCNRKNRPFHISISRGLGYPVRRGPHNIRKWNAPISPCCSKKKVPDPQRWIEKKIHKLLHLSDSIQTRLFFLTIILCLYQQSSMEWMSSSEQTWKPRRLSHVVEMMFGDGEMTNAGEIVGILMERIICWCSFRYRLEWCLLRSPSTFQVGWNCAVDTNSLVNNKKL